MKRLGLKFSSRSFNYGSGGISQVALLMKKVIIRNQDILPFSSIKFEGLQDEKSNQEVIGRNNDKLHFLSSNLVDQLRFSHFLFDQLGTSRVSGYLPVRRPSMSFIHGIEVWENGYMDQIRASKKVDYLLSVSEYSKNRAHNAHGIFDRASVCLLSTLTDDPPSTQADFSGRPTVLIIGRLHRGRDKGHRLLISIWKEVVKSVPDALLKIAGAGDDYDEIKAFVECSGAQESIQLLGFVPEGDLDHLFSTSWLMAMPSVGEGFGLVYIEAMRYGLPVIASLNDAGQEINIDESTGFNIDVLKKDILKDRIISLLTNPQLCKKMGDNGLKVWKNSYRYSAFEKRFLQHLFRFSQ